MVGLADDDGAGADDHAAHDEAAPVVGFTDEEGAGAEDQAAHEEAAPVVGLGAGALDDQAAHDDSCLTGAVVGLGAGALDQPSHPADVGAGFLLSLVVHCCHVLDGLAALVVHSFH